MFGFQKRNRRQTHSERLFPKGAACLKNLQTIHRRKILPKFCNNIWSLLATFSRNSYTKNRRPATTHLFGFFSDSHQTLQHFFLWIVALFSSLFAIPTPLFWEGQIRRKICSPPQPPFLLSQFHSKNIGYWNREGFSFTVPLWTASNFGYLRFSEMFPIGIQKSLFGNPHWNIL